ncbi:MAG: hypothetical protein ABSA30_07020 [Candidatus Aminicenantales bacterium]|jgi:hypothetical protein
MKKLAPFVLLAALLAGTSMAQEKFSLVVTGSALWPTDGNYKAVYGKAVFFPEIKLTYALGGDFFVFAGYGLISVSGTTPILQSETQSTQHFISAGAGYDASLSGNLAFEIAAGLFFAAFKETVADDEASGSAIGFRADAALRYGFSPRFFAQLGLGYLTGSDTVDGVPVKLGGLRAGLGFGYKF